MATVQQKIFCVREFIKTESPTAVQRAFRLRFNIKPPTRKGICRWNHQFEQIGCLCKSKSSGRPSVSEKNVRRIQESSERSPRKSTRRASRELGIPQPTVWRVLRRRLLFNWVHLFESPYISETMMREGIVALSHRGELSGSGALRITGHIMETDSTAWLTLTMLSDGLWLIWCHSGQISTGFSIL